MNLNIQVAAEGDDAAASSCPSYATIMRLFRRLPLICLLALIF